MRGLTVLQPWATLIAIGAKRIETRSWPTSYRGPVLIHAGKSREYLHVAVFAGWAGPLWGRFPKPEQLPLGAVVAVADLVDCVQMTEAYIAKVPMDERRFGYYLPGRYAWHLANVRALDKPVPAQGQRGLWRPSQELLKAVESRVQVAT
ncbi:MAG: hypothetical protein BAA04_07105 [Firmicutes bacterium ZCTH02-B6]|nr:MAG: hypothetical protein BAA04_07105 [Firmicutes bacterium ZCTH02-B6]